MKNLKNIPPAHLENSTARLSAFLRSTQVDKLGIVDRLKISCRPYICPFRELLGLIRDGETVFDVGCGSGQFCLLAAKFACPRQVTGIEINEQLVRNAQKLAAAAGLDEVCGFERYNGRSIPSSMEKADIVFLIDVLHHIPPTEQDEFIKSLYSGMKHGARLVIKDIEASSFWVIFNRLHDVILSGGRGHERRAIDVISHALTTGFKVQSLHHRRMWVYPHYTCIVEKPV